MTLPNELPPFNGGGAERRERGINAGLGLFIRVFGTGISPHDERITENNREKEPSHRGYTLGV